MIQVMLGGSTPGGERVQIGFGARAQDCFGTSGTSGVCIIHLAVSCIMK